MGRGQHVLNDLSPEIHRPGGQAPGLNVEIGDRVLS